MSIDDTDATPVAGEPDDAAGSPQDEAPASADPAEVSEPPSGDDERPTDEVPTVGADELPRAEDDTVTWAHAEPSWTSTAEPITSFGSTQPTRTKPRRRPGVVVGTAAVLAALVAAGTSYAVVRLTGQSSGGSRTPIVIRQVKAQPAALSGQGGLNIPAILAKVEPAVVDITATGTTSNGFGVSQFEDAGTGMIISSNGLVLTNNHVVAGASNVRVTLYGQSSSRPAKIIGTDPAHDVALLQIEGASNLPTVTFGDSSALVVGDPVVAIGNALALQGTPTVTQGIVSALNRTITATDSLGTTETISGMIQTDAPISSGNSGGPLVDAQGDVVGMNTAVIASSGQTSAQNLGFAESINSVLPIVKTIEQNPTAYTGSSTSPSTTTAGSGAFLGVGIQTLTPTLDSQLGLPTSQTGVLVEYVYPGSGAANAGIQPGDVITAVDGQAVTSANALATAIHAKSPGQQITLSIVTQSGAQQSLTATLGTSPAA